MSSKKKIAAKAPQPATDKARKAVSQEIAERIAKMDAADTAPTPATTAPAPEAPATAPEEATGATGANVAEPAASDGAKPKGKKGAKGEKAPKPAKEKKAPKAEKPKPYSFPYKVLGDYGSAQYYDNYMDRFNRIIKDEWTFNPSGSLDIPLASFGPKYDLQGNVVAQTDSEIKNADATPKRMFEFLSTYDNLQRLRIRQEGELNGGFTAISTQSRLENCTRNAAGRISTNQVSLNGDSDYNDAGSPALAGIDAGEMDDARTYNKRNELTSRTYSDYTGGSPYTRTLVYDKNGNLTDDGEKYSYVYNPFGQLVEIHATGAGTLVARYTYNGLGQRISEQTDTNDSGNNGTADGSVNGNDAIFFIAVDQQGRRVATYRATDTYPKETFVYHAVGRGPAFAGGVLLRDRDASLSDPTKWAKTAASSSRAERHYYAGDCRGNVIGLVDCAGLLVEQARTSQSGIPFGLPLGNVDGTGTVSGGIGGIDYGVVNSLIGVGYQSRADIDLDGDVDSSDLALVVSHNGIVAGRRVLSAPGVASIQASSLSAILLHDDNAVQQMGNRMYDARLDSFMNATRISRIDNMATGDKGVDSLPSASVWNL